MQISKRKVNDMRNNLYDTNELLELLEGHEDMTAFEFVCRYILEVEPENILDILEPPNQTEVIREHRFLVQKHIEGELYTKIYTETELINYLDMSDCSDEEYRIFDISLLGEVKEVFYQGWQPNRLIEVADKSGNIVVSGYGTDH